MTGYPWSRSSAALLGPRSQWGLRGWLLAVFSLAMGVAGVVLLALSAADKVQELSLEHASICSTPFAGGCVTRRDAVITDIWTRHVYRGGDVQHVSLAFADGQRAPDITLAYDANTTGLLVDQSVRADWYGGQFVAVDAAGGSAAVRTENDPGTAAVRQFTLGMAAVWFLSAGLRIFLDGAAMDRAKPLFLFLFLAAVPSALGLPTHYGIGAWLVVLAATLACAALVMARRRSRQRRLLRGLR